MNRHRILEIANGATPIMGEKENLAKTALHFIDETECSINAFKECGIMLLEAQAKIETQAARIAELEDIKQATLEIKLKLAERVKAADERIAEQQAVIDQRNGECDRLINELAALREQKPVDFRWRWASDTNSVWTYCHMDKYADAANAFGDNAIFELVYTAPPAAQPAVLPFADNSDPQFYGCSDDFCTGWNHHAAEVLRLNSGSKPQRFVVKLPDVEKWRSPDAVRAQGAYRVLVEKEIKAAGGEIVE